MAGKPGRNEPCWCGSKKKFKHCHLGREREQRLPLDAVRAHVEQEWNERLCLHPLAGPTSCSKVSNAHTLQRAGILTSIAEQGHVLTFYGSRNRKPRRVGIGKASTFTGFCARHDDSTFAPVEKQAFSASQHQCSLLGGLESARTAASADLSAVLELSRGVLLRPGHFWSRLSHEHQRRFQTLVFPAPLQLKEDRKIGTPVGACFYNDLREISFGGIGMVAQNSASWNLVAEWLRLVAELAKVA